MRRFLSSWVVGPLLGCLVLGSVSAGEPWIGFTRLRTNLEGGRHANVRTSRAMLVRADGTELREFGAAWVDSENTWTQFAGWSPDGRQGILAVGWKSPETAAWEEEHREFRFTPEGCRLDAVLVDFESGQGDAVTARERVSFYNGGLFFWPGDPGHLGFTALIDGVSHPFRMKRDGSAKEDLSTRGGGFAYGFNASPDGKRIAYHADYQIVLADADGTNAVTLDTGHPFNFAPSWSPDGRHLVFVSGQHYDCHPFVVRADGTGLRQLSDRGGYRGVIEFLDVADFHGGSSDVPVWARDGQSIFHTRRYGEAVELVRVDLSGEVKRLTMSVAGVLHYHPQPSPDGTRLIYGSLRDGVRQLYVMDLETGQELQITDLRPGEGAMWAHWRPMAGE